jgi:NAD(P)-dependent dehydrogenase (short-subunit alcohol dehydrogenase family)
MKQVIVITGASSGFGRLSANALAKAGHTVYASMRDTTGRNKAQVADVETFARDNGVDLAPSNSTSARRNQLMRQSQKSLPSRDVSMS